MKVTQIVDERLARAPPSGWPRPRTSSLTLLPTSHPKPTMPTAESTLDSRITSAIARHPHLKRKKLRFETEEGRVVLRGVVSSYYQKQLAQEALRRLEGIDRIENQLEVNWS